MAPSTVNVVACTEIYSSQQLCTVYAVPAQASRMARTAKVQLYYLNANMNGAALDARAAQRLHLVDVFHVARGEAAHT